MKRKINIGAALERALQDVHMSREIAIDCRPAVIPMRRAVRLSVVAALLVIGISAIAVAGGSGLFARLLNRESADPRLEPLETLAPTYSQRVETGAGFTAEIQRAFFTDARVFIGYAIEFDGPQVYTQNELPEDFSPEDPRWLKIDESALGEYISSAAAVEALKRGEVKRVTQRAAAPAESLRSASGDNLPIISGDTAPAEGGYIGWKECSLIGDALAGQDSADFTLDVYTYDSTVVAYDGGFYSAGGDVATTSVSFSAERDTSARSFRVSASYENWSAEGDIEATAFDISGRITVNCPADWIDEYYAVNDTDDVIIGWALYSGERLVSDTDLYGGYQADTRESIFYDICFMHSEAPEQLQLVPVYALTGAHKDEPLPLAQQEASTP